MRYVFYTHPILLSRPACLFRPNKPVYCSVAYFRIDF